MISDTICKDVLEVGTGFFLKNRRLIKIVFVLKSFLLFNSRHPNLVCSRSGIRRTKPRHPEYRLKWSAIWRTKPRDFHTHSGNELYKRPLRRSKIFEVPWLNIKIIYIVFGRCLCLYSMNDNQSD